MRRRRGRTHREISDAEWDFMRTYQRLLPQDEPTVGNEEEETMAKSTGGRSAATGIGPKGEAKLGKVFHEYGKGELRSGSKSGPKVTSHDQAIAIALAQARKVSRAKGSGK